MPGVPPFCSEVGTAAGFGTCALRRALVPLRGERCIAVHSTDRLGVVYLVASEDPQEVLDRVEAANPDAGGLLHSFQVPARERIEYDVAAPKNRWVITKINTQSADRKFDRWPRIEGEWIGNRFSRGRGAESPDLL